MEAIITVVGFLGAGKTTLLKKLIPNYIKKGMNPFLILNDYENASLDAQQFLDKLNSKQVKPLNGSCICCSGINELRDFINKIPIRKNGVTLVEANGTSDACSLMGFMGVGLDNRFLPPVQISVVDVKNWQKREDQNDLEANQVQTSSLIVLTHIENTSNERIKIVSEQLIKLNSAVEIIYIDDLDVSVTDKLTPSKNKPQELDHLKTHWSSCSVDLPTLPASNCIYDICNSIPKSILRIKGCAQIKNEKDYIYFERTPDGKISIRPFNGVPSTGTKLLTIGPGSNITLLNKAIKDSLLS